MPALHRMPTAAITEIEEQVSFRRITNTNATSQDGSLGNAPAHLWDLEYEDVPDFRIYALFTPLSPLPKSMPMISPHPSLTFNTLTTRTQSQTRLEWHPATSLKFAHKT